MSCFTTNYTRIGRLSVSYDQMCGLYDILMSYDNYYLLDSDGNILLSSV